MLPCSELDFRSCVLINVCLTNAVKDLVLTYQCVINCDGGFRLGIFVL
jgi:hypothetical protein